VREVNNGKTFVEAIVVDGEAFIVMRTRGLIGEGLTDARRIVTVLIDIGLTGMNL
jgi:hypothetical protein